MFFFKPEKSIIRCCPLYLQAIQFYDHPDNLVRTSIRTITLQILTVYSEDADFKALILSLPFIQYFGQLAVQLREYW